jgi:hypothetical protein
MMSTYPLNLLTSPHFLQRFTRGSYDGGVTVTHALYVRSLSPFLYVTFYKLLGVAL